MKRKLKSTIILLITLCMTLQNISILANDEVQSYYPQLVMPARELSIPKNVGEVDSYIDVPVYFGDNAVEQVTVHLNKYTNGGKTYDGDVSFKVKGYAYKNKNSSEVILGLAIGYYGYNDMNNPNETPQWYEEFIEAVKVNGIGQSATVEQCKELMANNKYSLKVDSINYQDLTQDARVVPIISSYKDKNLIGTWRDRATQKHAAFVSFDNIKGIRISRTVTLVEGQKNQWDVKVQVQNPLTQSSTTSTATEESQTSRDLVNVVFNDTLASQFRVISSNLEGTSISKDKATIAWNIGQLNEGVQKTLTYRIEMISGNIGASYPISSYAQIAYAFANSTDMYVKSTSDGAISNPKVKANWAKVNVKHLDEKDMSLSLIKFSDFEAWIKVPDNFQEGQFINISPYSKINSAYEIIDTTDSIYISEKNKPTTYTFIGMKKADKTYDKNLILALSTINTDMSLYYSLVGNNIKMQLELISSGNIIDKYGTIINDSNTKPQRILTSPVVIAKNSTIKVDVQGENLKKQEYKLIKGTQPILPISDTAGWSTLGELNSTQYNLKENYPDFIDTPGFVSTRHYNYKYGDKTPTYNIPSRANTFNYGIGESLVIQKANISSNNQYYSTAGNSAFFGNSATGMTNVELDFVPSQSGAYTFAVYTNGGAKGTITINGVQKTFVETAHARVSSARYIRISGTDQVYNLEAGKSYHMTLEWQHYNASDPAPCLYYQIGGVPTEANWQVVPKESLVNEKYIGGANKAVKFWGYLAPQIDKAGKFNLGSYSDDGVYGYIIIGNEKKVFAENWQVNAATIRTGTKLDRSERVSLELEPGKVYPIYMEWYEGCPTNKAFLPKYTTDGGNNWETIPEGWFYPSSDPTPGEVDEAYFIPNTISQIPLGEEPGVYYSVIKLTDSTGKEYQQLYGPVEIKDTVPVDSTEKDKNMLVPESVSNVWWTTKFNGEFKDVEYRINMDDIVNKRFIEGIDKALFELDLNNAHVNIKEGSTVVDATNYTVTKSGNTLIITFNTAYITKATETYQVDIYIPTKMGSTVVYSGSDGYMQKHLGTILEAKLKVYGSEKYIVQTIQEDGSVITSWDYRKDASGNVPEIANTQLKIKCQEIPKIN